MITQLETRNDPRKKKKSKRQYQLKEGKKSYFEQNYFLRIFLDWFLLNIVCIGFFVTRFGTENLTGYSLNQFLILFTILNLGWFVAILLFNGYWNHQNESTGAKMIALLYKVSLCFGLLSMIYYYSFYPIFEVHFLIPSLLTFSALGIVIRAIVWPTISEKQVSPLQYAVIGGGQDHVNRLGTVVESAYGDRQECIGRFGNGEVTTLNSLGTYDQINDFLHRQPIDKLYYLDSTLSQNEVSEIVDSCRKHLIEFQIVPKEISLFKEGSEVEYLGELPIISRKKEALHNTPNKIKKRIFDVIFSFAVIILVFPWLFPIVAILIKLESPGPVFFRQKRTGYWNKPFEMLKFRTMVSNAEADTQQALFNDRRVTKIGRFLRMMSLDEMPQFLNVLKGDMSVVGPRPHMLKHTEDYRRIIDGYMLRHEVKPGITGWAQVNGWRGPTKSNYRMLKRVEHDVYYIENWSFWFDMQCIFLTVFNVFRGERNAI